MANPFSTGAVHVWIGAPIQVGQTANIPVTQSREPLYLGSPQPGPLYELDPRYNIITNDVTGPQQPLDLMSVGYQQFSSINLTRWNEDAIDLLRSIPHNIDGIQGAILDDQMGALMLEEGLAFPVWYRYARRNNAVMQNDGMKRGRHYYASVIISRMPEKVGTQVNDIQIAFQHLGVWDATKGVTTYYDFDMAQVENLIPQRAA